MTANECDVGEEVKAGNMEEFYTVEEIANLLKMSKMSIYRFVKQGLLTAIKIGGRGKGGTLRFRQRDIDLFSKKCTYKATIA